MSNGKDNLEVGLKAFAGLLDEFRRGNIANKKVARQSLWQHLSELSGRWDKSNHGIIASLQVLFLLIVNIGLQLWKIK